MRRACEFIIASANGDGSIEKDPPADSVFRYASNDAYFQHVQNSDLSPIRFIFFWDSCRCCRERLSDVVVHY
jgi:hypothetical protein